MFSLGFFEVIILLSIALVFLGPKKLPSLAKDTARWIHRLRSMRDSINENLSYSLKTDSDSMTKKSHKESVMSSQIDNNDKK